MDLDGLIDRGTLTDISILEQIDEFTLYCEYLGYEPELGPKYHSPVRDKGDIDDAASFSIFPATRVRDREYMWKDHGTGKSGDIFALIRDIHKLPSKAEAYRLIDQDFALGLSPTSKVVESVKKSDVIYVPKLRFPTDIRVVEREKWYPRELLYWNDYTGAGKPLLDEYQILTPKYYWTNSAQVDPYEPRGLCFAYRIGDKFKIYRPHAHRDFKFRNNLTENHIEGFSQLRYNQDLLIITKSMKDVICLRVFGYEAIAARSENTLLTPEALKYQEGKYKKILELFDNDGKHRADDYPYDKIFIPENTITKDTSDHHFKYGYDETGKMLYNIIGR